MRLLKLVLAFIFSLSVSLSVLPVRQVEAATLRMYGNGSSATLCPKGLAYVSLDHCDLANANATFKEPNAVSLYALDATGNPQTIYHPAPFNQAGIDFPVGVLNTVKKDPRTQSIIGVATISANRVIISTIGNGGAPQTGMYIWDRPAGGTQHYTPGQAPKISGPCTGSLPTLSCPLDRSVSNRSAFSLWGGFWYGCVDQIAGIDWGTYYGSVSTGITTNDFVRCDFRGSAATAVAQFRQLNFAAAFGHNATLLTAISHNNTTTNGTVDIDDSYFELDPNVGGAALLETGLAAPNIRLILTNSELNGGNAGNPLLGPYNYPNESAALNWDSPGSTTWGRNQVLLRNIYLHDWSGRPLSTQAGNTDTIVQNIYSTRINLNCGDTVPPQNGCHGTLIGHGTTIRGSSGSIIVQNITGVYPYGQRNGTVTGMISLQGGVSSANSMSVQIEGITALTNNGDAPGHAILDLVARVARVGVVTSIKLNQIYANSPGVYQCFSVGGDLQSNATSVGAMVANAGSKNSTIAWSGFVQGNPSSTLPYPGTFIGDGPGSSQVQFTASFADNGNGTSTMNVQGTAPPTIAVGRQVAALRMADTTLFPTLIVSRTDASTYIVSNGSGSGETRAAQAVAVVSVLMPFGTINPATGLPSTATGGSSISGYNGTWVAAGERTYTAPNPGTGQQNWSAFAPGIGNVATIDADVNSSYWMMNIAGSTGQVKLDGVGLANNYCPGNQPP